MAQTGATGNAGGSAADAGGRGPAADAVAGLLPMPAGPGGHAAVDAGGSGGRRGLRTLPAVLVAVAGGLALETAFPPAGIWPLAAVGPALLVVALWQRSLRGSFVIGLCFGLAFFVPLISWLINLAWYAWGSLALAEAVIFALFAIGQRLMLRLRAWPVFVACWWVAAEAFRDRWPYAFPWGRLAMSQAQAPTVRWVAIGGPPLLTFLVALAGTTLAWLLVAPGGRAASARRQAVPRSPSPPPPAWSWRAACCRPAGRARASPPRRWPRCRATSRGPTRCRGCCGRPP